MMSSMLVTIQLLKIIAPRVGEICVMSPIRYVLGDVTLS